MARYLELEVSLAHIRPRIWRRFLLAENATFLHLHEAIQAAFGWQNYHLFEFFADRPWGDPIAGLPDPDGRREEEVPDASEVRVGDLLGPGKSTSCAYLYDFGDDWAHEVKVRKAVEDEERFHRRLLAGARSGPPEDCGGVYGYERAATLIETGNDPEAEGDEDTEHLRVWLGDWRPDGFELERAKALFDADTPAPKGRYAPPGPQIALPEGTHTKLVQVSHLLVETMTARGWPPNHIVEAEQLWADYVTKATPKPRKPAIYAASVEYCLAQVEFYDVTQGDVANAYGTSTISVSKTWRLIWDALGLKSKGGGWVRG